MSSVGVYQKDKEKQSMTEEQQRPTLDVHFKELSSLKRV